MGSLGSDDEHDWINSDKQRLLPLSNDGIVYSRNPKDEKVVWDYPAYGFLADFDEPPADLVNPSLWRQSQLCYRSGLFLVTSKKEGSIYQIRSLDLSNMTIVQIGSGDEIIVIDPLTSIETAKAAIELYVDHQRNINPNANPKVKAMIYTHSHVDHFGGAEAILPYAVDKNIPIPIYAPEGFLEHAVSENIYAGNAMARRSVYMYGESLRIGPAGQVSAGLGLALSQGTSSLVAPTHYVKHDGPLWPPIDGMELICQLTPGTEAPSEMNFFFPSLNALCMAENATHTLHNLQTLRGAPVRDARLWSRYLDEGITLFGDKSEVVFSSHHWPTWNTEESPTAIVDYLSRQRDCYAYLHNETLRHLNNGLTPVEIAEVLELPGSLRDIWDLKGYYGSVNHNVKAIYDKYMGWFDGNPANLWKHPPKEEATRYVDCMGGPSAVITLAQGYVDKHNDLRFASTLLSHAVFAYPDNTDAREALAHVYRKLGYGAENATWRNIYLTGAKELEGDIQPGINTMAIEGFFAFSLDQLVDSMAIRIEGPRAWSSSFTIDLMVTYPIKDDKKVIETGQKGWHMRMSNGALTGHAVKYKDYTSAEDSEASLTLYVTHTELVELVSGKRKTVDGLQTSGNPGVWEELTSLLTIPNKGFNIITPSEYKIEPTEGQ